MLLNLSIESLPNIACRKEEVANSSAKAGRRKVWSLPLEMEREPCRVVGLLDCLGCSVGTVFGGNKLSHSLKYSCFSR